MADIPSDALVYNGHSYYLYSDKDFTWDEAKTYCKSLGGHLATITDEGEQEFIENLLAEKGIKNNYWLGGYKNESGKWKWVTKEKFNYTNWDYNEPNDYVGRNENVLMIFKNDDLDNSYNNVGKWNDAPANGLNNSFYSKENFGFICEWEQEENSWTLNGTTAKYGTSDKTLVTVKGVKSLDGLKVDDKIVTVSESSLNKKKVTISGDGYTLKLGSDVSSPKTKKAAFSLSGSTATYKSSYKTAGYTLASDGKSITYSKATTAETLATIQGAKSTRSLQKGFQSAATQLL